MIIGTMHFRYVLGEDLLGPQEDYSKWLILLQLHNMYSCERLKAPWASCILDAFKLKRNGCLIFEFGIYIYMFLNLDVQLNNIQ